MSEEIKHPNTPNAVTEQDKGHCDPALSLDPKRCQAICHPAYEPDHQCVNRAVIDGFCRVHHKDIEKKMLKMGFRPQQEASTLVKAMDIQLMIDNLVGLSVREQRDILLKTLRNLVDYVDDSDNTIEGSKTIAEFLNTAADGKL